MLYLAQNGARLRQANDEMPAGTPSLLSAATQQVLLNLCAHASTDRRQAWPSVATVSAETGLSARSVRQALDLLEAAGWIVQAGNAQRDGRYGKPAKRWQITLPGMEPLQVRSVSNRGTSRDYETEDPDPVENQPPSTSNCASNRGSNRASNRGSIRATARDEMEKEKEKELSHTYKGQQPTSPTALSELLETQAEPQRVDVLAAHAAVAYLRSLTTQVVDAVLAATPVPARPDSTATTLQKTQYTRACSDRNEIRQWAENQAEPTAQRIAARFPNTDRERLTNAVRADVMRRLLTRPTTSNVKGLYGALDSAEGLSDSELAAMLTLPVGVAPDPLLLDLAPDPEQFAERTSA